MTTDATELARVRARERVRAMRLSRHLEDAALGELRVAVERSDLASLDAVKRLLGALNDAYIGGPEVGRLVPSIPVLAARCRRRAFVENVEAAGLLSLEDSLRQIGNSGLEVELLGVLEDLTMLCCDEE